MVRLPLTLRSTLFVAVLLAGVMAWQSPAAADGPSDEFTSHVLGQYPSAQVYRNEATLVLYGTPMTRGATAEAAVEEWFSRFGASFGIPGSAVVRERMNRVGHGPLTVFAFRQELGGLVVEGSLARIVVRHDADPTVVAPRKP